MKNIRIVMLGEMILLVGLFLFCIHRDITSILWFIDFPSAILILLALIPGLIIMGEWKDFVKAFSIGIKPYSLLELKNIIEAVGAAQKLAIYGALLSILISGVMVLVSLDTPSTIGPKLAVCLLSGLYAVIIEFFLLPLKLNAERKMNEEMDLGDE